MPTLVDFLRHYLPIRFGGSPAAVVADASRVMQSQSFQPVGLQDFLTLQVPPREMLLDPILPERSAWLPMQNWLLRLRRKGVAVLLVHHAGVNGRQRGTSRREDALDTVIALRRPGDYSPEQGARFEVHLEKTRSMVDEAASPFEVAVELFRTEGGKSGIRWMARDLKPSLFEQATTLFQEGRSVNKPAGHRPYPKAAWALKGCSV